MGETSILFTECVAEHLFDAEIFSKKFNNIKHCSNSHPEYEDAPYSEYSVRIVSLGKLERQLVSLCQTIHTLLNSKNEYIQNCISRITVEEALR